MAVNNHKASNTPLNVTARVRAQLALDLRTQGYEWQEIADRVGYANKSNAFTSAHRLLERQDSESADKYRRILTRRMEKLHTVYYAGALGGEEYTDKNGVARVARPNPEAANICLQIYDRMMKLHGLDKDAGLISVPQGKRVIIEDAQSVEPPPGVSA